MAGGGKQHSGEDEGVHERITDLGGRQIALMLACPRAGTRSSDDLQSSDC
jgi:hypothetical protein